MALRDILIAPDPLLNQMCEPVANIDSSIKALIDDMYETMYENDGCGLAAPQVGILKRILVFDVNQGEKAGPVEPTCLINPEIIELSEDLSSCTEGCLSLPGQYIDVARPSKVKVKFFDYEGKEQIIEATGLKSTCIQHEMDHLNGVIFTNYISKLKRQIILNRLKKYKRL